MTVVCRQFGISRKTGYKLFERYQQDGPVALADRSRHPVRYANQLPAQIESLIVTSRRDKPHWGARKIREILVRRLAGDSKIPAISTIHAILDRHGLVKRMGRKRHKAEGTPLSSGQNSNDLWCTDFKGEFKLGDGRYCYPLTVTDHAARLLLMCEAHESTREIPVISAFERLFTQRGLPAANRADNGLPFASPNVSSISRNYPSGGSASASRSNASSPAIPSRTDATNGCIASHLEKGSNPPARHEQPAATGTLRQFRSRIQYRTPARGTA